MYGVAHLVDDLQQVGTAHGRVAVHQPGVRLRTAHGAESGRLFGVGRGLEGSGVRSITRFRGTV
jgi:hypothetical protein